MRIYYVAENTLKMTLLVLDFEMPVMDTALPHKEALKKEGT